MDVSAIEGQELTAIEFVSDFLRLRFDGPLLTLYAWPHILLEDFSLAFGQPEYRNALCAQIGEMVAKAKLEELDSLTIEFESGTVIALSLREEDMDGPEAGSYSASGERRGRGRVLANAVLLSLKRRGVPKDASCCNECAIGSCEYMCRSAGQNGARVAAVSSRRTRSWGRRG